MKNEDVIKHYHRVYDLCSKLNISGKCLLPLFSKSVLDIKTRLVVTVELGRKWMPNSDSVTNFMPEYKFLGY